MIEHRHTKRVQVSDKVTVYHRGSLVAMCDMKDISTEGMAIWGGPLQYRRNTMLEVEINVPSDDAPNNLRLMAMVVYSHDGVVGLMFGGVNKTARTFLRRFIDNALNGNINSPEKKPVWETELKTKRA